MLEQRSKSATLNVSSEYDVGGKAQTFLSICNFHKASFSVIIAWPHNSLYLSMLLFALMRTKK
jgi:hypothetical protein